jgi:C-terminal processing protease CtpA/Prc/Tol biopolymer transport system component
MAQGQWWRNGHAHIDEAEIWLVHEGERPTYERVSEGGKNLWPMWSPAGDRLYFMSDRDGAENLWTAPATAGATAEPVTTFREGRVLWPSIALERPVIAFERGFGIWTHDAETGRTEELDVRLLGSVEGPAPELERFEDDFDELAVSPDELKLALVVRGEIFAAAAEGDAPAVRVTDTPAAEADVTWSADSERIAYTSWRHGTPQIFLHDFGTGEERRLTSAEARDADPSFSPDGRWLAYNRDGGELRVIELENGTDRRLAEDTSGGTSFTWSPDSRWIAYGGRTDEFTNVMVVPVDGGEPRQASFLANSFFGSLGWSRTGEFLVFRTSQRTEPGRLARVDLVPRTPTFHEDRFWDLFNRDQTESRPARTPATDRPSAEPEIPEPPSEVEIDFEGIRRRGYFADLDFSVGSVVLSPDAEHAAVTGQDGLYWVALDEDEEPRRLGPGGQVVGFSADGRRLWMLREGRVQVVTIASGEARTVEAPAELTVDFEREKAAVFEQAWGEMRDGFYDDAFHGADWDAVRARFAPRAAGARTRAELNRLLNMMMGELNASHLGHSLTGGADPTETGRLGLRFDRLAYESQGAFRVTEIVPLSPADVADGIDVGDYLVAVDGEELDASADLHRMLAGTPGDRVRVTVADNTEGAGAREIELQPIELGAERELVYRGWVEGRRAYVDELSGGRLGYVHIASMSEGALNQLVFDLDQVNHAREGVVVDVRNNNGGFVNVYAIDILARRNYFTMENRGGVEAPSRVQLGQRALLAPTVLVTNQHTLSDGEDFTEGYRTLGLGSVVGEPTAGWIIYTGGAQLVDGSSVRMPRTRIRDTRGQVMELNPRAVDIEVERPAGESYLGRDSQLERAVEELLARIDERATTSGSR